MRRCLSRRHLAALAGEGGARHAASSTDPRTKAARTVIFKSLGGVQHADAMEPFLTRDSAAMRTMFGNIGGGGGGGGGSGEGVQGGGGGEGVQEGGEGVQEGEGVQGGGGGGSGGGEGVQEEGRSPIVVVYEPEPCPLATALLAAYRRAFADCEPDLVSFIPFSAASFFDDVQAAAAPSAAVVLIQNGAFQNALRTYRVRMRLWDLGLRVAEHGHLEAMTPMLTSPTGTPFGTAEAVIERYMDAVCLCPFECEKSARHIATALDASTDGVKLHTTGGNVLRYEGPLEKSLLNTGCFYGGLGAECDGSGSSEKATRSVGGSYPFGEVITESFALSSVNGTASVFAYPNRHKRLEMAAEAPPAHKELFTVTIEKGCIVDLCPDTPDEFRAMVGLVKDVEGQAVIRELGIGLNPHLSRSRAVADITAFERQFGLHFSLGKRHPLFPKQKKPASGEIPDGMAPYDFLRRRDGKFHLDVFMAAERVTRRSAEEEVLIDFSKSPAEHIR